MGGKTVIMGVAVGDDKTTSFDIKTEDFTSGHSFHGPSMEGKALSADLSAKTD